MTIERPSSLRSYWNASAARTAAAAHTPRFQAEDLMEFVAIRDGERPVALLHRPWLRLEMREFYPDGRCGGDFHVLRPYHGPSMRGAMLTVNWWLDGRQSVCSATQEVIVSGGGPSLDIRVEETFGEDEFGHHHLRFSYDAELGCYTVEVDAALELLRPRLPEVSNFYSENVGVANPDLKRMQYTLWTNRGGGLTHFPHNPLTPNLPGNMDLAGRRGVPVGGFLAYGADTDYNPALEILASHTEALGFATCSCFYDEHFLCGCPAPLGEDGKYRWRLRYRLVSIPRAFAEELRSKSALLDFGAVREAYDSWPYLDTIRSMGRVVQPMDQALPFVLGAVNDMERAIDPRELVVGRYWILTPQPHGAVLWDRACGYRSASSLCLVGRKPQACIRAETAGPVIRIHPHKALRFRAMVKTDFVGDGQAWLELWPHSWSTQDCTNVCRSERVSGRSGWREVQATLPPQPEAPHLALYLKLEGEGRAWFDDVALTPLA